MSLSPLRRVGLRPLFIAAVTGVVLLTSALLGWALLQDRSQQLRQELAAKGQSVAATLAAHAEYGVLVGDTAELSRLIEGLRHDPDMAWASIAGEDGAPLASGPADSPQPWRGAPRLVTLQDEGPGGVSVREAEAGGAAWLIVQAPVRSVATPRSREELGLTPAAQAGGPQEVVGAVTLVLSEAGGEQALADATRLVMKVTAGVVLLGLLLTVWLSTVIVSPVLAIAAASRRIARGEMGVSVAEGQARELVELIQAFNHMSEALTERDVALQQNAAELRAQATALVERGKALEGALATVEERNLELRLSQEQLRSTNAELLHASRLKSAFLASMSHELRTPLNSIIGYTECLIDGLDGPINEDQKESLERVQRNGRHLLGLIGDILDLSKIESGKMELSLGEVDLGELARECMAMVRPLAQAKALPLNADIAPAMGKIKADAARIRQVLINLLSNAVKFTDAGHIAVSVRPEAGGMQLTVADTGRGIPADRQEDIFVEFQQLEGPTSPGTGLGLAITRRLVELMGGTIRVESAVGDGSAFTVWLPEER